MISLEQALRVIESSVLPLGSEDIPLEKAMNRVLAQDLISDADMPPFNKAAMDGYACRRSDLNNELTIIEEIPAGKVPVNRIGTNQCAHIMTGAMIPEGLDWVFMKEHAELKASDVVQCKHQGEHSNICFKGEDIKSGEAILKQGVKLLPAHLASLASAGCMMPKVYKMPGVAVISTGDELVEPDKEPGTGKIRNSNGLQLVSQSLQFGLPAGYLGIVPDNRRALLKIITSAIRKYHVILISGGVSVGDYDFVPDILSELQVEILFHGMNVKPGKHLLFGKKDNHFVIGMPGNPVSSFVQFEMLVKPLLSKLMGNADRPVWLSVPLAAAYSRKNQDTLFFIPVNITAEGYALPLEYHGSAHIHAYCMAQGIMEVPTGVRDLKKGEIVHVRPI
jgi:molybdopterin molybdotransferase